MRMIWANLLGGDCRTPCSIDCGWTTRGSRPWRWGSNNIANLRDPIGSVTADWARPNGMKIQRVSVPLGVIGIIYESRPNVTADAGGLCLKSGNAVILRGGSESVRSCAAIHACLEEGLEGASLPADAASTSVPTTDRAGNGRHHAGRHGGQHRRDRAARR